MSLAAAFRSLSDSFSLEVVFGREPTEAELAQLCKTLPLFCVEPGFRAARLNDDLGMLLFNHIPIEQLPHSSVPELDNVPHIWAFGTFSKGSNRDGEDCVQRWSRGTDSPKV